MSSKSLPTLDLTHTGLFSERVGALLRLIATERGLLDIGIGLGLHPSKAQICVMINVNDQFATAFSSREAKGLVEIIRETMAEEEPPTQNLREMLDYIADGCTDLSAEIDELERAEVERKLN